MFAASNNCIFSIMLLPFVWWGFGVVFIFGSGLFVCLGLF